jgi:hypothetical protein
LTPLALKKLLWFAGIYGVSVAAVGAVSLMLRAVLKP